jgi:hypothetical protein
MCSFSATLEPTGMLEASLLFHCGLSSLRHKDMATFLTLKEEAEPQPVGFTISQSGSDTRRLLSTRVFGAVCVGTRRCSYLTTGLVFASHLRKVHVCTYVVYIRAAAF